MTHIGTSVLVGLDAGGSYVKATAFDLSTGEVSTATRPVTVRHPHHGHNERDAEDLWRYAVDVIGSAVRAIPNGRNRVRAIGLTGHGNGLYLVNEKGHPTYPAIQASDTRAAGIVEQWEREGIPDRLRSTIWNDIWPGQPGPLLAWLHKNNPEVLERSAAALMCGDYLRARLTGSVTGELTAWSCNGILDSHRGIPSQEAIDAYGISDYRHLIPPIIETNSFNGVLSHEAANLTGLPEGIPVSAGVVDNVALQIGAGILDDTRILVGAGTWSINQLLVPRSEMRLSGALGTVRPYAACVAAPTDLGLLIEASATSASTLAWAIDHVQRGVKYGAHEAGKNVYEFVLERTSTLPRADDDVMFLPYLDGSRRNPSARGSWMGLSSSDDEFTLLGAVAEGVCMEHRRHVEQLDLAKSQRVPLRLAGGASRSPIWSQLFADVTGRSVEVSPVDEIGTVGAAVIAGTDIGIFENLRAGLNHLNPTHTTFSPNLRAAEFYEKRYTRYLKCAAFLEDNPWVTVLR